MNYRDSASFGKRQEYVVIAELLKRGFDVYMTLVDDQGIDCVVRLNSKRYLDIQIKARSREAKQWNFFAALRIDKPRDNYYFIFYTEKNDTFYIIPSKDVVALGVTNKTGKHAGVIGLNISQAARFEKYKNDKGFSLLKM